MLTAILAVATIALGVWLGFATPATARSLGSIVGGAAFFFVAAVALYGWQCDAATIPDILLFRDVPGQYFCNGRLTLLAYALMIAVPILSVRALAAKFSTPNA